MPDGNAQNKTTERIPLKYESPQMGLKNISHGAFAGCESLESIALPDGLERIGVECFERSGLRAIVLPESVREVGAHAFYECWQLRSVRLNKGLAKLGEKETVNGTEHEGEVFSGSAVEGIRLPSTLKRITARAF